MSSPEYTTLLESALRGFLPEGVKCGVCHIPDEVDFEYIAEEGSMRSAGDYRKREFIAGRGCARVALRQLDFPEGPILSDADGIPVWPEGAVASISHSCDYCAAIAGHKTSFRALGLDFEKTNRLSVSAIERAVHPHEQIYVQSNQRKASLLFSAKEAFFKMQYPIWQTSANFHDIVLVVDESAGTLRVDTMGKRFPDELRSLAPDIQLRFSYFEDFVVTTCWLKPAP